MSMEPYTTEQLRCVADHRDSILEKYRTTEGITVEELQLAADYKQLSEEEAEEVIERFCICFLYKENHALDAWFHRAYGDK